MNGFETIFLYVGMSFLSISAMLIISALLGPLRPVPKKLETYECGVPLLDPAHKRFSLRYYVVAVLFLIFDIETILLYPVAIRYQVFARQGWAIFFEVFIFVAILLVGLFYAIIKRGIERE